MRVTLKHTTRHTVHPTKYSLTKMMVLAAIGEYIDILLGPMPAYCKGHMITGSTAAVL